jgi:uncharacterized protein (TIGR03000 family)
MFRKVLSLGGMPLLAAAVLLLVAEPAAAARPGGRGGGFRGGFRGVRPAFGFRGGFRGVRPAFRGVRPGFRGFRRIAPAFGSSGSGYGAYSRGYGYYPSAGAGYYTYPYSYLPYGADDDLYYYDPYLWEDLYGIPEELGPEGAPLPPDLPEVPEDTPEPIETGRPSFARAHVHLRVPANAEVWFEGTRTPATGAVRNFRSPPLQSGERYVYEVRARWRQGGRPVTQTQRVIVEAGANVTVTFPVRTAPKKKLPVRTLETD